MTKILKNVPVSRDWHELLFACGFTSVDPYLESLCASASILKTDPTLAVRFANRVSSLSDVIEQIRADGWQPSGIIGLLIACSTDQSLTEIIAPGSVFDHDEYGPLIPYVTQRNGRVLVLEPQTERISGTVGILIQR